MITILNIDNLSKAFDGIKALSNLSVTIYDKEEVCENKEGERSKNENEMKKGSIIGIIGPNGAGKTTLFDLITGFLQPDEGQILYKGQRIDGRKPYQICQLGISRTFQMTRPYHGMSVIDSVLLGSQKPWYGRKKQIDKAMGILKAVGLYKQRNLSAGSLSCGQLKMLGVSQALMTDPKLLLLDEPTAGASQEETPQLMNYIASLKNQGVSILIVEHRMRVIMKLCERVIVLDAGRVIAEGKPGEIQKNEGVKNAYLGQDFLGTS